MHDPIIMFGAGMICTAILFILLSFFKKEEKQERFPQYSLVKFSFEYIKENYFSGNFNSTEVFVYLGECPNMSGHCIVADGEGKITRMYHPEDFQLVNDNDI